MDEDAMVASSVDMTKTTHTTDTQVETPANNTISSVTASVKREPIIKLKSVPMQEYVPAHEIESE